MSNVDDVQSCSARCTEESLDIVFVVGIAPSRSPMRFMTKAKLVVDDQKCTLARCIGHDDDGTPLHARTQTIVLSCHSIVMGMIVLRC